MVLEIDGQLCSTRVTRNDDYSWCGVVERREKSTTGDGSIVFRANVEVHSISALIKQDDILRKKIKEESEARHH